MHYNMLLISRLKLNKQLLVNLTLCLINVTFIIFTSYLYQQFIRKILNDKDLQRAVALCVVWLCIITLRTIINKFILQNTIIIKLVYNKELRSQLITSIYDSTHIDVEKETLFDYVKYSDSYLINTNQIIAKVMVLISYLFLILILSWELFALIVILFPFTIILSMKIGSKIQKLSSEYNIKYSCYNKEFTSILKYLYQIKENNAQNYVRKRFAYHWKELNILFSKRFKLWCINISIFALKEKILSNILLLLVGGYLLLIKQIVLADLVVVVSFSNSLSVCLDELNRLFLERKIETNYIKKICAALSHTKRTSKINIISVDKNELNVTNLCFSYKQKHILHELSLPKLRNGFYGIVGLSGSGKTTLVKIIAGVLPEYKGEIIICGQPLQSTCDVTLFELVGAVMQDAEFLNLSILDNLLMSNPTASKYEIEEVLRKVNMLNFVNRLPNGINSIIGENGSFLSRGYQQKLAIARLLLKAPPIMLFDESTSNIDAESEAIIMNTLYKLAQNHIIIFVSHKLETVRNANCIFVLNNKTVEDYGTDLYLQNQSKVYLSIMKEASVYDE